MSPLILLAKLNLWSTVKCLCIQVSLCAPSFQRKPLWRGRVLSTKKGRTAFLANGSSSNKTLRRATCFNTQLIPTHFVEIKGWRMGGEDVEFCSQRNLKVHLSSLERLLCSEVSVTTLDHNYLCILRLAEQL